MFCDYSLAVFIMVFLFEKRYKYFILGIIVASLTWSVSLYLYSKLSQDSGTLQRPGQPSVQPLYKQRKKYHRNDVILPYEDNDKQRLREKNKYLESGGEKPWASVNKFARQKLHPVPIKPLIETDDFEGIGLVKNVEDLKIRDEGYRLFGFNALASKNLDYHRDIPDTRHKLCKDKHYSENLPSASVVICFYNEQFDTLVRSVHSVIDRTPQNLLHEIILVDDASDIEGLHDKVKQYMETNLSKKVKLFLTRRREGLIRARIFGADKASGDVLIFLDSHIEVNVLWVQPLLQRVSENRTNVVTPIIDIINADTFRYDSSPIVRGGFNWGLHFKWENLPLGTLTKEEDFVKPIMSPTMAGGLFAIERNYFIDMGKYDSGMDVWGGENLEISFRIWMCGGRIEIIPCSRVGHVFRKRRPYGSPTGEDTMLKNSLRVAHVWLDQFIDNYFKHQPEAMKVHFGDVSSRVALRNKLKCHPFSWYLENIYPQLSLLSDSPEVKRKKAQALEPNSYKKSHKYTSHYQIRLSDTNLCVASEKDHKSKGSRLVLKSCLRVKNQMWSETENGEFRLAQYLCMDAGDNFPKLGKCHEMGGSQQWKHKVSYKSPIYNVAAGMCLSAESPVLNSYLTLSICANEVNKQWDLVSISL